MGYVTNNIIILILNLPSKKSSLLVYKYVFFLVYKLNLHRSLNNFYNNIIRYISNRGQNIMSVKTEYRNDVAIIKVNLRATIQQAASLKQSIEYDMNQNIKDFIIDLSECEFFDSTFIGVMVVTLKRLQRINGNLKIIKAKNVFQSMLDEIGGSKLFDMYDTSNEALYSFGNNNTSQPVYNVNYVNKQEILTQ